MRATRGTRACLTSLIAVGLAATAVWLHRLGDGDLAPPPMRSWSATSQWYDTVGADVAVMAVVRLLAFGLLLWLLVVLVLQVVSVVLGIRPLHRLADLISPRSLQRLGQGLVGLSLTAGLAAPAPGAGIPDPSTPGTATMHLVDPGEVVGTAPSTSTSTTSTTIAEAPVPLTIAPPASITTSQPPPPPPPKETVVVEAGDSLWSIAAEEVGGGDDRVISTYWRRLIEANRARLVDPANPDLIYPGQTLELP